MQNDDLKTTILFLFDQIDKTHGGATKYNTLKLLYLLKRELSDDHPLKNDFAFYWYLHGPFSEHIVNKLDEMEGRYIIKEQELGKNYELYKIKPDFKEIEPDSEIIDNVVRKTINKLLQDDIFFNLERIVYSDAPYPFMPLYKIDFIKLMNQYKTSILNKDEDQNLIEKAITTCYKCEGKLPFELYFSKYEELFSEFLTGLDKLHRNEMMPAYLINEKRRLDKTNELMAKKDRKLAIVEENWNTFAHGVRIKKHEHHDDYENYKTLNRWDKIYQNHLSEFNKDIKEFSKFARENSKPRKIEFSETSKKILLSTLGTYLTCDNNG